MPEMEKDGTGLASVLDEMAGNRPDDFNALQLSLRRILPQVERVRYRRTQITTALSELMPEHTLPGHEVIFDFVGARDVPAHAASEGTLIVLGLLAGLMNSAHPRILLMDDLDRGLHPKAMKSLVLQLREWLKLSPDAQIIATTHSPYLIDQFSPQEVRLTTTQDDGSVVCAALHEHPDFDRWKDLMLPGELWSTVGEDWVKKLRAS